MHRSGKARRRRPQEARPSDREVSGADVVAIGASFFELRSGGPRPAMIPYHRVLSIDVDGERIWERRPA